MYIKNFGKNKKGDIKSFQIVLSTYAISYGMSVDNERVKQLVNETISKYKILSYYVKQERR